jgi:hypothetical protein
MDEKSKDRCDEIIKRHSSEITRFVQDRIKETNMDIAGTMAEATFIATSIFANTVGVTAMFCTEEGQEPLVKKTIIMAETMLRDRLERAKPIKEIMDKLMNSLANVREETLLADGDRREYLMQVKSTAEDSILTRLYLLAKRWLSLIV